MPSPFVGAVGLPVALALLAGVRHLRGLPPPFGTVEPGMLLWIVSAGVIGGFAAFVGAFVRRSSGA